MNTRRAVVTSVLTAVFAAAPMGMATATSFPDALPLPNGWQPEGIATGAGTTIYSGSLATGSIWKGDLRTGQGSILVTGDGRPVVGLKVDRGRIFAAGGASGTARVYDARTGRTIADFTLTTNPSFINDVIVTRDAAYFTNSQTAEFYRVSLGRSGAPTGRVTTIPLTGDWQQAVGFNANGIAATANGAALLIINSTTGTLYRVDSTSGVAKAVNVGGADLTQGDGILLRGQHLYVVRNFNNQVVELRMAPNLRSARVVNTVTDPDFDVPTTIAAQGSRLYVVNARFSTPPSPTTPYDIVAVDGK